jgi:hypothetical protein
LELGFQSLPKAFGSIHGNLNVSAPIISVYTTLLNIDLEKVSNNKLRSFLEIYRKFDLIGTLVTFDSYPSIENSSQY